MGPHPRTDSLEDPERLEGSRMASLVEEIAAAAFASREDPPGTAGMLDYVVTRRG